METINNILSEISLADEEIIEKYKDKLEKLSKDEYFLIAKSCLLNAGNKLELFKFINSTTDEAYYKQLVIEILSSNSSATDFIEYLMQSLTSGFSAEETNDILKDVIEHNLWALTILKKYGLNINFINSEPSLYYLLTLDKLHPERITAFIEAGVDVDINKEVWNKAFMLLISNSAGLTIDILNFLKEKGFAPVKSYPSNISVLMRGYVRKDLLEYVKDEINSRDIYSNSPLDMILCNAPTFDWLTEIKPDYLSRDSMGMTAFYKLYQNKDRFNKLVDYFTALDSYHFMEPFFPEIKSKILNIDFLDKLTAINTLDDMSEIEYLYSIFNTIKKDLGTQEVFLFNTVVTTLNYMYEQEEITSIHACLFEYLSLDNVVKLYKTRRDFPSRIRDALRSYLMCLPNFSEIVPKQNDEIYEAHHQNSIKIKELALSPKRGRYKNTELVNAWISWINQHQERKEILELMLKKFNFYSNLTVLEISSTPEVVAEKISEKDKEEFIDLYSVEALERFKKDIETEDHGSKSKNFLKKITTSNYNNKTLAKASVLLESIDSFYTRFPHFHKVIKHIESYARLQQNGDGAFYIPPLLMCGGPGVGKTFFSNELAKMVSTHFHIFNTESISAGWIFNGLSDTWNSAQPGKIFKTLSDIEQPNLNPIFLLDELDKAAGDSRYPVANTLLPLLERYTAKVFKDECIPLQIDASYIIWFATANSLGTISAPIKSRFDIFDIPTPNFEEKKN